MAAFKKGLAIASIYCQFALLPWAIPGEAFAADISIAPGQSCSSVECHERFGKEKHVHPAMEDGECSSCHEQQGEEHAFELSGEGNDLCYFCHDQFDQKRNQHEAVEMGCTSCHNPHQSQTESLLEADSVQSLCFACHDESMIERKWVHGPAQTGECMVCHNPHESDNSSLLIQPPPELCYVCHSETEERMKKKKFIHAPVADTCASCHDPHGEDIKFFLKGEVPQLCYSCHEELKDAMEAATFKHEVIERDKRCLNCHQHHASNHDSLLNSSTEEICFSCHDKVIETPTEKLKDMKSWIEEHKYPHGPVLDNDCTSCHNPHGSTNFRILKESFPQRFYAPFTEDTYALCFSCHDKRLVLYEKTTKRTDFRNGAVNLHYLHVNKPVKGRKCTACHEVHAGKDPKHLAEKTIFGTWEMPIRFKKTETGGSCSPGCHKKQAYDREEPVAEELGEDIEAK